MWRRSSGQPHRGAWDQIKMSQCHGEGHWLETNPAYVFYCLMVREKSGAPTEKPHSTYGEHASSTQKLTVVTSEPPCCPNIKSNAEKKNNKNNEKLMGICGKLCRQFPLPWVAAPTRAGGVPLLCGYHTPSSGCSGLKEWGAGRCHWLLFYTNVNTIRLTLRGRNSFALVEK